MRFIRFSVAVAGILTFLSSAAIYAADQSAWTAPRYSLPVGRELVYSNSFDNTFVAGKPIHFQKTGTWQILVARENPDSSRHLILHRARMVTTDNQPEAEAFGWADVFPDGRVNSRTPTEFQAYVFTLFPRLPEDEKEIASGWTYDVPESLSEKKFSTAPVTPTRFAFEFTETGPLSVINEAVTTGNFSFDSSKGLIVSASVMEVAKVASVHSTEEMKLQSDTMTTAQEAGRIGREWDVYFAAHDAHEEQLDSAQLHPDQLGKILADAGADFRRASASATIDPVRNRYQAAIRSLAFEDQITQGMVHQFQPFLNKPVMDFDTTDYDGKRHKLSDYRGKVLVLDSWNRTCGPCMRLIPQIKQLADGFKDKPVVILGEDRDNESEARVVIDAMKTNYPTLYFPEDKPFQASMLGNPSMFIIDQKGILRATHCGYSPTLRKDVGKLIQSLLDESPSDSLPTQ